MKIGIFGGTFNPPHKGHLRLIETFAAKLELDKVLVIPDKRPVHKICEDHWHLTPTGQSFAAARLRAKITRSAPWRSTVTPTAI